MGNTGRKRKRRATGPLYRVSDPQAFGDAVLTAIKSVPGRSVLRAARALKIPQQTLSRVVRGEASAIRLATYRALLPLWGEKPPAALTAALIPPDVELRFWKYVRWFVSEHDAAPSTFNAECRELIERVYRILPEFPIIDVLRDLDARAPAEWRRQLAALRALSGLLDHTASGNIERDWTELSDHELRNYVRAGLKREAILARRPPDPERLAAAPWRLPDDAAPRSPQTLPPLAAVGSGGTTLPGTGASQR